MMAESSDTHYLSASSSNIGTLGVRVPVVSIPTYKQKELS
jgi:hypothetical protein